MNEGKDAAVGLASYGGFSELAAMAHNICEECLKGA